MSRIFNSVGSGPYRKNRREPTEKAEVPFSGFVSSGILGTIGNQREPTEPQELEKPGGCDPRRWLKSVLREDVVPLQVVTARARVEGLDMQALWRAIRESCIQQDGMSGTRYLKLPRTIWALPKPTPHCGEAADPVAKRVATKAALARLRLLVDERIVCGACCFSNGTECPSGQPIPDNVPNRCQHFQEKDWK